MRDEEDALSFNWHKYADVDKGNIVLGLSYTKQNDFQNYKDFTFFKYPCEELLKLEGVERIEHNPLFNGNPSAVGFPNNKSHSLLFISRDDPEVRVKLSTLIQDNYDQLHTVRDERAIDTELELLRNRNNDTPYHKLWEFDDQD